MGNEVQKIKSTALPVLGAVGPFVEGADSLVNKIAPLQPQSSPLTFHERWFSAAVALGYGTAAIISPLPFVGGLAADALVGLVGKRLSGAENEVLANHGRLAMQTGVTAAVSTSAGFALSLIPFTFGVPSIIGGVANALSYGRAAYKAGRSAIEG